GRRRVSHWRDDTIGRRGSHAHEQLAGRSANLGAERPGHPVLPHHARARRQIEHLAGRPHWREPTPPAYAARWIRPELGADSALSVRNQSTPLGFKKGSLVIPT